jgi:hypothetical protein
MIELELKGKTIAIPSKWEELDSRQFIYLAGLLNNLATGSISVAEVRMLFLCHCLHVNISRKKLTHDAYANIYAISLQLKFIFSIEYDPKDIEAVSLETRKLIRKTPASELPETPEIRFCKRLTHKYVIESVFCRQLLPVVKIGKYKAAKGYTVNISFGVLSTSLTALQFIEASEILSSEQSALKMPLLASILYSPLPYNSEAAHANATRFANIQASVLTAISINFQAFTAYLFKRSEFALLNHSKPGKAASISTGMLETLFNLSSDGLGDAATIKQLNVIEFLTIMRKKLIESVRTMNDMGKKLPDIEEETHLPIEIIKNIVQ